ncbi:methionine-S-sulfoxide reductase [Sporosarcina sp. NCCP-2222]|uniref:peptide-methionine (S)-S-oxide reductase MsrA n=1 Tax=Sporosarcina sp. NCCP-2222 TaxID=2935073 RepID=UPI00208ABA9E|nr:peptide-methionine (S)-S-oxide reductase MsrA [Sporosarcina sp. NCCP-2222]GKV57634.1 methionine-S-sulfoxide reductase [Sporosarcina sp. NCCP-2222]
MYEIPEVEQSLRWPSGSLETATFGMGCFWGPEARFGSLKGIVRTRVGFAGGTTASPTYRSMGDHTETVEVDFDPELITYEEVLRHFWRNHYPNRDEYKGRQYISLLRYGGNQQKETIDRIKKEMEQEMGEPIETDIGPFENFTWAEERHQKYYLKRYPRALEQLHEFYPEPELLVNSTLAARLNGFVKGFGSRASLLAEIEEWEMDNGGEKKRLEMKLRNMKW